MKRLKNFIAALPEHVTVTKTDFILSIAVGVLSGIIFGMLISPRKYMHIGCNNGSGNHIKEDKFEEEE